MSQHDDLDRMIGRWLEAEVRTISTEPVLDRALRATAARRPRRRPLATVGSRWAGGAGSSPGLAALGWTGARGSMALAALLLALALIAGGAFVGARLVQPSPVQPPAADLGIFSVVAGRLVYADDAANGVISGVDPDASADPATAVQLAGVRGKPLGWSRDGTHLLIMRHGEGGTQLFVLRSDGAEVQVTEGPAWSIRGATISPDGSRVVFAGSTTGTSTALYAVDVDGGPAQQLVGPGGGLIQGPAYSPDGTWIAYAMGAGDHSNEVWRIGAAGGTPQLIIPNDSIGHVEGGLAWSPAGDRIAIGLAGSIYTFAPDGSDFRQVAGGETTCGAEDPCAVALPRSAESPYWSPDGSRIAYTTGCAEGAGAANRAGCHLAVADTDGSNVREFSYGASGPWHPGALAADPSAAPSDEVEPTQPSPEADGTWDVIVFAKLGTGAGYDLAAQDPETGEVRKIVETDGLVDCEGPIGCKVFVRSAEWSPDGRSVAFQVSNVNLDGRVVGPCAPTVGVWVALGLGDPRQLTMPCESAGAADGVEERWTWSPDGTRVAAAGADDRSGELVVIDARDGTRTVVASGIEEMTGLAWSPDGTHIAFADGDSLYAVGPEGGAPALLGSGFADIVTLAWSPDGGRLLVQDQGRYRIQVMNVDGSDLHVVLEGLDACCSTAWSPAGDRILYMLSVPRSDPPDMFDWDSEVWTVSPNGTSATKVFDTDGCDFGLTGTEGDTVPVWGPDGGSIAYNDCGTWVVARADGTGEARPVGGVPGAPGVRPMLHRSWDGGALSAEELLKIGLRDR